MISFVDHCLRHASLMGLLPAKALCSMHRQQVALLSTHPAGCSSEISNEAFAGGNASVMGLVYVQKLLQTVACNTGSECGICIRGMLFSL